MAYAYPLSIAAFADLLSIESVEWGDRRNDELSGTGDARVWQAELADPLWTAVVTLSIGANADVKQIAARVRKLYGSEKTFMLFDPLSKYPQSDPDGSIITGNTISVQTVGAENKSLVLNGFPAGYTLTLADKFQIPYASTKNYFGEVSETVSANGSGVTPEFEVFPHLPVGLQANDTVTLIKPACEMFIMPATFKPGTARAIHTEGASFVAMERRR